MFHAAEAGSCGHINFGKKSVSASQMPCYIIIPGVQTINAFDFTLTTEVIQNMEEQKWHLGHKRHPSHPLSSVTIRTEKAQ